MNEILRGTKCDHSIQMSFTKGKRLSEENYILRSTNYDHRK